MGMQHIQTVHLFPVTHLLTNNNPSISERYISNSYIHGGVPEKYRAIDKGNFNVCVNWPICNCAIPKISAMYCDNSASCQGTRLRLKLGTEKHWFLTYTIKQIKILNN